MNMSETISDEEKTRLEALYEYAVLDTSPEKEFDDLTQLAADLCDAPIARINLIDFDRQWSKSTAGSDEKVRDIPREIPRKNSVCQYTIQEKQIMEVHNLAKDSRFKNFSYVRGATGLRYYLGAPLIDSDGHAIGSLCVLDYRVRSMSEKQKENIEIVAREVMARLELRKQNAELKKLNEHKIKLMKMLSHDMRSPLNGIIGMSSMLSDLMTGDEELEMLGLLEQSAVQLNQMIDEILTYSVIESDGFRLNLKTTDLDHIVQSMKRLYQPVAKSKNIEVRFDTDVTDTVCLDRDKFEQIYGNLLSNAIKFTREGGKVNSRLTLSRTEEEGQLQLVVQDNGVGMDEDTRSVLFQDGEKELNGGTSGEKSTGLGLAIVKYFVDLHRGTIDVDSKPGKGTEFTISIPIAEECF